MTVQIRTIKLRKVDCVAKLGAKFTEGMKEVAAFLPGLAIDDDCKQLVEEPSFAGCHGHRLAG